MTVSIKSNADGVTGALQVNGIDAVLFSTSGIYAGVPQSGFKNKIIGSDFNTNPWQRGSSFPAASNSYTADRWSIGVVGSAVRTVTKAADAPTVAQAGIYTGFSLGVAVTTAQTTFAASDIFSVEQRIEGYNSAVFGFGQAGTRNVALSFWVKGAKTGIHCVSLSNSSGNRSYVAEYTIIAINTWEYKTIIFPVDTAGTWLYDTNTGVIVRFAQAAGTTYQSTANSWQAGNFVVTANQVNELDTVGNNFKIALVQLEAGSVATSFETRGAGQEVILCQRYFEIGTLRMDGYGTAGNVIGTTYGYKVTKRAIPTVIYSSVGYSNASTIALDSGSSPHGFETTILVAATGGTAFTANFTSNAEL